MNIPVLMEALRELRKLNPKNQIFLILDYDKFEIDRMVAIYEIKIEYMLKQKRAVSRMRFVVKDGENYKSQDIVDTFMDKLQQNMKAIYR